MSDGCPPRYPPLARDALHYSLLHLVTFIRTPSLSFLFSPAFLNCSLHPLRLRLLSPLSAMPRLYHNYVLHAKGWEFLLHLDPTTMGFVGDLKQQSGPQVGNQDSPIRAVCDGYTLILYRALESGIIQCYTASPPNAADPSTFNGTYTHLLEIAPFTLHAQPQSPYFEFDATVRVNIHGKTH